jgi:hypothetical protein
MTNRYALIDHENVQPKDLALLNGQAIKVIVFLGASQTRVSADLAAALQARGRDGEYVRASGNGSNALDMHIAFYMGELSAKEPSAQVHVISKDKDYDPLIIHLRFRDVDARRSATLAGLLVPANERLEKAIGYLSPRRNRPRGVLSVNGTKVAYPSA